METFGWTKSVSTIGVCLNDTLKGARSLLRFAQKCTGTFDLALLADNALAPFRSGTFGD